jgi:hypothetical protein
VLQAVKFPNEGGGMCTRTVFEVLIGEVGSNTLFGNYTGQVVSGLDIAWTTIRRKTVLSDSLMQNGFVCRAEGREKE